jgi:hypothetical protein
MNPFAWFSRRWKLWRKRRLFHQRVRQMLNSPEFKTKVGEALGLMILEAKEQAYIRRVVMGPQVLPRRHDDE